MAFFECTIGGNGDGVTLIVQCDANFAGSTITADNGEDVFTEICPSVSPYTVRFEGIPTGTYTISGIAEGQTFTTQFTVLDYETTLNATPEGATVLPVNDIQIWLHCANIWDKNYTTISQVLADTTTLLALVSSNNAADYMARSTTWASDVCADQTAMGYIGNNNYCANKLLADSTWRNSICDSTYFESVLNAKVPTMTNYTTPSGVVSASGYVSGDGRYPWKCFTDASGQWDVANPSGWVQYEFVNKTKINKISCYPTSGGGNLRAKDFQFLASNDNFNTFDALFSGTFANDGSYYRNYSFDNNNKYQSYRMNVLSTYDTGSRFVGFARLQFYGRES